MRTDPKPMAGVVAAIALLVVCAVAMAAKRPDWPTAVDGVHVGIGIVSKKGLRPPEYTEAARQRALNAIAENISVEICSEFVVELKEISGLVEEKVRQEIRAAACARLSGYKEVDRWEDRSEFWINTHLSKRLYEEQARKAYSEASDAAREMVRKAETTANPVTALKFYFDALATLDTALGMPPPDVQTGTNYLLEAKGVYAALETCLSRISLSARAEVPVLTNTAFSETVSVTIHPANGGPAVPAANLPVTFNAQVGMTQLVANGQTDSSGILRLQAASVNANDDGKTVVARVDVKGLYAGDKPSIFVRGMLARLTAPQASMQLRGCKDMAEYAWQSAFKGRRVAVAAAVRTPDGTREWPKMRDELVRFLKAQGAEIVKPASLPAWQSVLKSAGEPEGHWAFAGAANADYVVLGCAEGKFLKRKGEQGGEDTRFSGEALFAAQKDGQPWFADRFRAEGGWCPMGETMCNEIYALNAAKRWKAQMDKQLGLQ